jgi:hypothetical protein
MGYTKHFKIGCKYFRLLQTSSDVSNGQGDSTLVESHLLLMNDTLNLQMRASQD